MSVYLFVRILHVVGGVLWVGAVVFVAAFLMPAVQDAGPDGAKVMAALAKRRFLDILPAIAGIVVLSGIWLYWRYTGGFDHGVMGTHAGLTLGTGGLLGIVAFGIGVLVMRRNVKRAMGLAGRAATLPDGPERAGLMNQAQALRATAARAGRLVAALLILTTILMSVAFSI